MTLRNNARIAARALAASLHATEALCKARGIIVDDLTEEEQMTAIDIALVEAFPPKTRLSDIWPGGQPNLTIADLATGLEARSRRRGDRHSEGGA